LISFSLWQEIHDLIASEQYFDVGGELVATHLDHHDASIA
jgi:hypothetical protein